MYRQQYEKNRKEDKMIENKFSTILGKKLIKITDITKKTNISRTTLTNLYYKRTERISLNVLDKLCKTLNCNINDLLEYKEIK